MQGTIDFTTVLQTRRENNAESQAHLNVNIEQFNGQCKLVYSLLLKGLVLTTDDQPRYGIGDLRARVRDLIAAKIDVSKDWVTTEDGKRTRFKKYFLKTP